jgi:phosphate transport system protein
MDERPTEPAAPTPPGESRVRRHPLRDAFDAELSGVRDGVLRMGSLVESQIGEALAALVTHDAERALRVIASDAPINAAQREVSSLITLTIATQQPVASDLRNLLALDAIAAELERMGDYAGSVAKQARKLAPSAPIAGYDKLELMGALAASQVRGILRAVVELDEGVARRVAARDDELDDQYHALFAQVLEGMRSAPETVDGGARILFAAHYLERVGDRVTNIAEQVVFLATGESVDLND